MGKLETHFYVGGSDAREVTPVNWQDIEITAIFDDDIQPSISVDEFRFVNEDATFIRSWFTKHPFEGMPFEMHLFDGVNGLVQLYGCLDFYDKYEIWNPGEIRVKIKLADTTDLLDERLKSVSYAYLAREGDGIIGQNDYVDVPVIVKKKFDGVEVAFTAMVLYLMAKETIEWALHIKEKAINALEFAMTAPLSKPAKLAYLIGFALLQIAYAAFMLIALIQMLKVIQKNLLPVKTVYKGMTLRKALTKACDHLGLVFVSNIQELDWYVYLPSKNDDKIRKNAKDEGIPNNSDYGYQLDEMFELCQRLFLAKKVKLTNSVTKNIELHLRAEKDPFWRTISNYVFPSHVAERYSYNVGEMNANYIISFQYDPSDDYTMPSDNESHDYFKGVNFQMITDIKDSNVLNPQYKLNRGLKEISLPVALGTRRDKLSALETALKGLFVSVDLVIKLFGGKTFGQKINDDKGALIISQPSFNVAKLVVIQNGIIPQNHRDLLSAIRLWNEYHYWQSFKSNPTVAQKLLFNEGEEGSILFDFSHFQQTKPSGLFTTSDGRQGKFRHLKWKPDADRLSECSYEISEQYMNPDNLTETPIEA